MELIDYYIYLLLYHIQNQMSSFIFRFDFRFQISKIRFCNPKIKIECQIQNCVYNSIQFTFFRFLKFPLYRIKVLQLYRFNVIKCSSQGRIFRIVLIVWKIQKTCHNIKTCIFSQLIITIIIFITIQKILKTFTNWKIVFLEFPYPNPNY